MEIIILDSNVEKLIKFLDRETASKIQWTLNLLENFGYQLRMPYCKKIIDNVFELRICGKIEVRIFYFFQKQQIIVIHSFIKKTQEIPKRELKTILNKIKNLN